VISTTREDSRGAWSPDGKMVAFNSDRAGDMNIWLHTFADSTTRQLTTGHGGDFQPNWSPDEKEIAFFSSRSGSPNIWEVEIASGTLRRLTSNSGVNVNPFYSPDGKLIAYQSDQSGRLEAWVMNADGGNPRQLTNVGITGHFMRWTADSTAVVFRCHVQRKACNDEGVGQRRRSPTIRRGDDGRLAHVAFARSHAHHGCRGTQGALGLASQRREARKSLRIPRL
jgi:Tol biopolymer transport system component